MSEACGKLVGIPNKEKSLQYSHWRLFQFITSQMGLGYGWYYHDVGPDCFHITEIIKVESPERLFDMVSPFLCELKLYSLAFFIDP